MAMTPERKNTAAALAEVVRIMGHAGVEFALIVHAGENNGLKEPMFIASDPPPKGVDRARDALEDCANLMGLMVAQVPEKH